MPATRNRTTLSMTLPRRATVTWIVLPRQTRPGPRLAGPLARLIGLLSLIAITLPVAAIDSLPAAESCWLDQLRLPGNEALTVAQIKQRCVIPSAADPDGPGNPVATRADLAVSESGRARFNEFFEPYKDTYLLGGAMRTRDDSLAFSGNTGDIKFKLGLKFRLFPDLPALERLAPLYFGYSQESWWDVAESSAPFKEHNYNPEIFWDYAKTSNRNGLNFIGRFIDQVGYEHQSNGQDGSGSRSWDRLYLQRQFQLTDRLSAGIKAWEQINVGEQNKDIGDYLGNLRLNAAYQASDRLAVRVSTQQGWETSKLSYQLDLVYRIPEWVNSQFMLSYYDGYGEALISYNQKTRSLRAGLYFPISVTGN